MGLAKTLLRALLSTTIPRKTLKFPSRFNKIYVGNLGLNVSEEELLAYYQESFPSTIAAKIIVDPVSKISKGYGFVKFSNSAEAEAAIDVTTGQLLKGRPIKTNRASTRKSTDSLPEIKPKENPLITVDPNQMYLYAQMGKTQNNAILNYPLSVCLTSDTTIREGHSQRLRIDRP